MNGRLTWHFGELTVLRLLNTVDEEYSEVGCHDGDPGSGAGRKDLGIDYFGVLRLLPHTERVLVLAEHVVDQHQAVVLNAEQFLRIGPSHRQKISAVPLPKHLKYSM